MFPLVNCDRPSRQQRVHNDTGGFVLLRDGFAAFRREEDGSMIVMTLSIFMFMMVMAGLGIDTMRHEMERAKLQSTLDSAVLAGAKVPYGGDAKSVVEDYFAKAEMSKYLNPIKDDDVNSTVNSSKVEASASMTMDTYLMKLSGVETLTANAEAVAQTSIPKLEISLVLDVSGSMGGARMTNLRKAAKAFTTTMLNSSDAGAVSISLVPFSTTVTPSTEIFDALFVDERHDYSTCLAFENQDFFSTALVTQKDGNADPTLSKIRQNIYTNPYGGYKNLGFYWRSCLTEESHRILPYSTSETELHTKIDSLPTLGTTSGDVGIKWGVAMLDPSFRDVTEELIADAKLTSMMSTTPVDYNDPNTMKVVVMMGDGENYVSYYFADDSEYRGELSNMFQVTYDNEVFDYAHAVYDEVNKYRGAEYEYLCDDSDYKCVYKISGGAESSYFLRHPSEINASGLDTTIQTAVESVEGVGNNCVSLFEQFYNGTPKNNTGAWDTHECGAATDAVLDSILDDFNYYNLENDYWMTGDEFVSQRTDDAQYVSRRQMSWEEMWGLMGPEGYANITGDWSPYNEYYSESAVTVDAKNERMDSICSVAKQSGIIIYTIGYMVPDNGTAEQSLKKCATGYDPVKDASAYYYDVNNLDISTAFSSIAGNMKSLRLTQ